MSDGSAAEWELLLAELLAWARSRRSATFWWRDDDASRVTPALQRLVELSEDVPVALAVIPLFSGEDLAAFVRRRPRITVLQHGWAHRNHAGSTEKKIELSLHRPESVVLDEIAAGRARIRRLFGSSSIPVLTPPWNRIAAPLVSELKNVGIAGLSTFGIRPRFGHLPGLIENNAHVDLVDWRGGRRFVGEGAAIRGIVGHLHAKRNGGADPHEATGILTHHLVHGRDTESFLSRLFAVTRGHRAARWVGAPDMFAQTIGSLG